VGGLMLQTAPHPKPCRVCRHDFMPVRPMQIVCGLTCARRLPIVTRKAEKAADKARRVALRTTKDWMEIAQTAFNAWVRERDRDAGCIDCGQLFEPNKRGGSMDAGHFLSRGSAPHLRFDERNVFGQRKNCNRPGGATRADFRAGVVARIGLAAVEALEADQSVKQYRADDLKAITADYRARLKAMRA
jgi:hypothetical protein